VPLPLMTTEWRPEMDAKTERIRALNDQLRRTLTDGMAVITPGIAALGREAVERIIKTIAVFDDFCHANDPHQEHDFGSFEADGHVIFFKIDLYEEADVKSKNGEPVVTRVLTIMLASEY
jgi:hypothetical protein